VGEEPNQTTARKPWPSINHSTLSGFAGKREREREEIYFTASSKHTAGFFPSIGIYWHDQKDCINRILRIFLFVTRIGKKGKNKKRERGENAEKSKSVRKRGNKEDVKIRKRKGEGRKDVNIKFRGEEEEKRE
jgi:hypothetical protein